MRYKTDQRRIEMGRIREEEMERTKSGEATAF